MNRRERRHAERERRSGAIRPGAGTDAAARPTRSNLDLIEYVNAKWRRLALSIARVGLELPPRRMEAGR